MEDSSKCIITKSIWNKILHLKRSLEKPFPHLPSPAPSFSKIACIWEQPWRLKGYRTHKIGENIPELKFERTRWSLVLMVWRPRDKNFSPYPSPTPFYVVKRYFFRFFFFFGFTCKNFNFHEFLTDFLQTFVGNKYSTQVPHEGLDGLKNVVDHFF